MRNLASLFAVLMAVVLVGAGCMETPTGTSEGTLDGSEMTGDQLPGSQDNVDDILDDEDTADEDEARVGATSRNVTLTAQNDSGQNGSAMLTEEDGKTRVILTLSDQPENTSQPAHIHLGICPTPGAVLYPLNPVVDGRSETVLNTSLANLLNTSSELSVNVHKSEEEATVYMACGDIDIDGPSDTE